MHQLWYRRAVEYCLATKTNQLLIRAMTCMDLKSISLNERKSQKVIYCMIPLIWQSLKDHKTFPGGATGKELACQSRRHKRCGFHPWVQKLPWRRKWQPPAVFLEKEMATYSSILAWRIPWTEEPGRLHSMGSQQSDTTEWHSTQHSCLENPMDRGAQQATVHRMAESDTTEAT